MLFHEACGHGLEADLVGRDASVFRGRVGEQVASPLRHAGRRRHVSRASGARIAIDDEGAPAQRNVLIEDGVLTDYMWDLVRARQGGPREQRQRSARDVPAPADGAHDEHVPARRATRTPTTSSPTRQHGLYCVALGGGQVNTATGDFVFGVTEAYLIENGEITEPVRAAQLIGNGPETLRLVDAVGNDFDTWAGHVRQGRPGRAGVVGSADAAGRRAHRRRHRRRDA